MTRLFLIVLLLVGVSQALQGELLTCLQMGRCGWRGVCPFRLEQAGQEAPLQGHLLRLDNQLKTQAVDFAWEVLLPAADGSEAGAMGEVTMRGSQTLEAGAVRYIDTRQGGPHTLRLVVNGEPYRYLTLLGLEETEAACSPEQACDYLLRSCFMETDAYCKTYAQYCDQFRRSLIAMDTETGLIDAASCTSSGTGFLVWAVIMSVAFVVLLFFAGTYWWATRSGSAGKAPASY